MAKRYVPIKAQYSPKWYILDCARDQLVTSKAFASAEPRTVVFDYEQSAQYKADVLNEEDEDSNG